MAEKQEKISQTLDEQLRKLEEGKRKPIFEYEVERTMVEGNFSRNF
jgi:hypothetical protein